MTLLSHRPATSFTARPRRPLVTLVKGVLAGMFLGGARCGGPGYDGDYDDDVGSSLDGGDGGRSRADARANAPDAAEPDAAEPDAAAEEDGG